MQRERNERQNCDGRDRCARTEFVAGGAPARAPEIRGERHVHQRSDRIEYEVSMAAVRFYTMSSAPPAVRIMDAPCLKI